MAMSKRESRELEGIGQALRDKARIRLWVSEWQLTRLYGPTVRYAFWAWLRAVAGPFGVGLVAPLLWTAKGRAYRNEMWNVREWD